MRVKPFQSHVYRKGEWMQVDSDKLLTGDLIYMTAEKESEKDKKVIPCDMLIIHGNGIVDESILTGESVP